MPQGLLIFSVSPGILTRIGVKPLFLRRDTKGDHLDFEYAQPCKIYILPFAMETRSDLVLLVLGCCLVINRIFSFAPPTPFPFLEVFQYLFYPKANTRLPLPKILRL